MQKATRSSTPSSSSDQGAINSKQSIASLKEIETQSYLTATALDEVKKKLVEALNDSGSEDDRSFIRITELLENRRAVVQDIVAFFDELNREGSVDRDSDPLSDRIARLGQSLKNLEKKGVGEGQIKQVQLMITALEEIQDAFQEIDSFSLDDPKATESITRVVTQLQDLFDKLASGDIKSVEEFTGQYKKLVKEFESLTGDDHVLSSNTHIDQIEALLNFILKAQNKYDDMLAKRNSRDEQKSNILGIDVETLQSISERASDIIAKFNERILTLGDTEKLGRFNGIKSIVEDMEKVEAALGQGIHTEQWDADLNKLRQIIEIQQQANRNPEWRNLEIVRDYLSSIQPQNAEQAANAARTAADEAQREAAARQEILNLAAKARELVEDTTLPSGSGTPQNNTLTVNLGQVEEKIEGVNASLLKLTEGFTSEFPAMSAGVQQLVQEMTRLNQTATETSSALREMQTQRIGLDAESLKALTDAVTRGYQQANQGAKELAGTSDQVSESARKAMDAIESEAQQATSNVAQVGFQADRVIENLDSRLKVVSKEISGINSEGQKMSALVDADGKVISASRETRNDNEAIKKANSLLAEQKKTISEIYSLRAEMLKSDGGTQEQAKRLEELNARYEEIKATLESMPENVLSQRSVAKGLQDNAYLETSKQQA